ncbi:hypothetical protein JCM3770_000228 [Rhodotorula araucariae]
MSSYLNKTCPSENVAVVDQANFWDGRWDAHEIGWIIAGATAAVSTLITLWTMWLHGRNYTKPREQRQILRILLMPAVYAIVSFFSYRYFRSYTYYSVSVVAYESLVLAAFLMLLLQYIGNSTNEQRAVLRDKEKRTIPFPFCCIRFRPSKPYFLHGLKWSVLQYSLLRPLISIIEIICQTYDVLCPTQYSIYYAEVYLDAIDFISISVALYGLIVFYALVKERLAGRNPLAKFLSIKIVVMLLFYQSFVFSVLQSHGVIKGTEYWTATNVADGLSALCVCCEMVIMSGVFAWAFSYREYEAGPGKHTPVFWAILDSFNYSDLFREGWRGFVFLFDFARRKPGTHAGKRSRKLLAEKGFPSEQPRVPSPQYGLDFGAAFGCDDRGDSPDLSVSGHEAEDFAACKPQLQGAYGHGTAERRRSTTGAHDPSYPQGHAFAPAGVGADQGTHAEVTTGRPRDHGDHRTYEMGYPPPRA